MNFFDVISGVGGYASSLNYIIAIILYKYQCFMYERSLVKRIYWEKKDTNSR